MVLIPPYFTTVSNMRAEQTIVDFNASVIIAEKEISGTDALLYYPERWLDATPKQLNMMNEYYPRAYQ